MHAIRGGNTLPFVEVPVLGITGSIATGKSVAMECLGKLLSARVFSADDSVRRLLTTDEIVKREVFRKFGNELKSPDGNVDRVTLREIVFRDSAARIELEKILHPRVRQEWTALSEEVKNGNFSGWLLLEIPLLFETGADAEMDVVVVTACSRQTQVRRLCSGRNVAKETAALIIASQNSQSSKITRSQHLLWTDCPMARLTEQVRCLSQHLNAVYG